CPTGRAKPRSYPTNVRAGTRHPARRPERTASISRRRASVYGRIAGSLRSAPGAQGCLGRGSMNGISRVTSSWPAIVASALALIGVGAGLVYFIVRPTPPTTIVQSPSATAVPAPAGTPSQVPGPPSTRASQDVVVSLTQEATQRAGIVLSTVAAGRDTSGLRLPGIVQANAY